MVKQSLVSFCFIYFFIIIYFKSHSRATRGDKHLSRRPPGGVPRRPNQFRFHFPVGHEYSQVQYRHNQFVSLSFEELYKSVDWNKQTKKTKIP